MRGTGLPAKHNTDLFGGPKALVKYIASPPPGALQV